jgi:3-deoxy-D-manno-octulosonate 8-phosphate phosphatase (KDO 8-P phosphatase)
MQKRTKPPVNWDAIQLVIFDCDGVLTDGKIIYSGETLESKNFNAHDGMGFAIWHKAGFRSAVITGRSSQALPRRCADLNIQIVLQGIKNKLKAATELLTQLNLEWHQVAYMGDDWNDIPVMQQAALSVCPADAMPDVIDLADYTTVHKGGDGAVRDMLDYILNNKGLYTTAVSAFLNDLINAE